MQMIKTKHSIQNGFHISD